MANVKTVARKTLGWVSRLISIAALIAVFILSGMLLRSIAQTKKDPGTHFILAGYQNNCTGNQ